MTERLFLADLDTMSEDEVKDHIASGYAGEGDHSATEAEAAALRAELNGFDVLVAYESVGSFGCDSSSYFLVRDKESGKLSEVRGGHCSCYGFEGQWDPEDVQLEYLLSDKFHMGTGGYDDEAQENKRKVVEFFKTLNA